MKLKLIALAIISNCISIAASAQTFTADFSEKYNMFTGFENAVQTDKGMLVVKHEYDKTKWFQEATLGSLLLMNNKMEILQELKIPFNYNRFLQINGLYKSNGIIFLLYSYKINRKDDTYHIAALKINNKDLSFGNETDLGEYASLYGNNTPDVDFRYSVDSSKYFLFTEAVQKRKNNKQFYFKVLNSDLSIVNEKTVEIPVESKYAVIKSTQLDKFGNVYVEHRVYDHAPNERIIDEDMKKSQYETVVTQYTKDGKTNNITPQPAGSILHTAMLMTDKSGLVYIAGSYKQEKNGRIRGVYLCTYDPSTSQLSIPKMSEIPSDVLALLDHDKLAKDHGGDPGLSSNFNPCRLSKRENGSIDLALEYNITTEYMSQNSVYTGSYSEAILSVNIAKDFTFTRIPKRQGSDRFRIEVSNYSFYAGNKLVFIYNDDKDNADRAISKAPDDITNFRKSVLMAAIVDEKGNLERRIVYNNNDDKYVPLVSDIKPLNDKAFLIKKLKTGSFLNVENTKVGVLSFN